MRYSAGRIWALFVVAFASMPGMADELAPIDERIRVVSWNISGDAFASEPQAFESLLRWANPHVVLLDEFFPAIFFRIEAEGKDVDVFLEFGEFLREHRGALLAMTAGITVHEQHLEAGFEVV